MEITINRDATVTMQFTGSHITLQYGEEELAVLITPDGYVISNKDIDENRKVSIEDGKIKVQIDADKLTINGPDSK